MRFGIKGMPWEYIQDVLQRINDHPMLRLDELLHDQWKEVHVNSNDSDRMVLSV